MLASKLTVFAGIASSVLTVAADVVIAVCAIKNYKDSKKLNREHAETVARTYAEEEEKRGWRKPEQIKKS